MAQQENLMEFTKTLRINDLQTPSERSKKGVKVDKTEGRILRWLRKRKILLRVY